MHNNRLPYLIHAIAENGDEQAFDELFRIYYPALLSYTYSILKDRQDAEEICLDVLFKLWQNRKVLSTIKNLSHYLYIAVKHAAISYMRTKGYQAMQKKIGLEEAGESFVYELGNHELRMINKETLERINAAINTLPSRCRLIFRLIKEDGLKYAEVAQLLEISVKTVENQMTIAMKKLTAVIMETMKDQNKNIS
ncbi:MAG: RNA polymerase sigma-70 factor [Chitinophagaceae bacterium]|nr:RNA polymerase sigma-70 factor [Chitinophagaceae bacterium]